MAKDKRINFKIQSEIKIAVMEIMNRNGLPDGQSSCYSDLILNLLMALSNKNQSAYNHVRDALEEVFGVEKS